MRGVPLSTLNCSVARTLDIVGERWTLLVLRDAFQGVRRFDDFASRLPIARNVLSDRLRTLVDNEILRVERYQERPGRFEYRLTEKGMDLYPVLIALLRWGDRHLAGEAGPPLEVHHRACDGAVDAHAFCTACGEPVTARDALATQRDAGGVFDR
jgi:DNA-binding HxlR family transcriptional regulator